jgi:hypothetical protein
MPDNDKPIIDDASLGRAVRTGVKFLQEQLTRRSVLSIAGPLFGGAIGYLVGDSSAPAAHAPSSEDRLPADAQGRLYVIESVHYMCHLQKGSPGPSGVWGDAGSCLLAKLHITYTYRANGDVTETDERFETQMTGASLRSFFATTPVVGQGEPPGKQKVNVKLSFPLKKGEIRTYATGVDVEYVLPLTQVKEMTTVEVTQNQYFIHYPNVVDYIRHATMTIESTDFSLTAGQFSTRKRGQPTETKAILTQSPCLPDDCGQRIWHPVVTASVEDVPPGADFGLRVTWA